jgi:hypothetical protein
MDTNMEDVGRAPAEASPVLNFEPTTIPTLDGWIESLMSCKQLAEADVQRLCDKVRRLSTQRDAEPGLMHGAFDDQVAIRMSVHHTRLARLLA